MKTDFKFSNLLGTVYRKGNLLFTPDGNSLLSPVGNRVTIFDLPNNKSYTLPFAHRRNIARLAINPQGNLLLTVDEDGRAILTNLPRQVVLYHFSFKSEVSALVFSPTGYHFAAGVGRQIEIWNTPSSPGTSGDAELEYAPFVRHRVLTGHFDVVQGIEWSSDSRFLLSASKDLTARIWSLNPEQDFVPTTLAGHRQAVLGAWFSKDQEQIYTLGKDGALFLWKYQARTDVADDDPQANTERWRITQKHFFNQHQAHATCAAFHADSNVLVAGFSNGVFVLCELPDFTIVQNLSISQNNIDFVTINKSGEWLAFGASQLGQLLVWEWQSESHILKQQGHFDTVNSIVYSPDGQRIITTADDGKVKVWDTQSGFCIVTFTEHSSGVMACEFAKRGSVLFTASLDGSVRAWDLIRYRNFRTFTAPTRLSFSSLAVDPSGEVVCAGSLSSFDIHIWSVQTGQLLDQLAGHTGPVASLAFAPNGGLLLSGSWDGTVRMWSIFDRSQTSEPLQLQSDVLCVAFRPDSKQIAVSSLDGQVTFWSVAEAMQQVVVDSRRDVSGGRKLTDRRTAANSAGTKSFSTLAYSADGTCVIAAGPSKYICLYEVNSGVLVKKWTVSINLSLDGTQEFLNSRLMTEAGPRDLIDTQGDASDPEDRFDRRLPGATRGDKSQRRSRPEVRVSSIAFSPTARSFCAASTEGLLIYSLDGTLQFDPIDLDVEITPSSTLEAIKAGDYVRALAMSFRLNDTALLRRVYESVPISEIKFVARELPNVYLARLLRFVAEHTEQSQHLEFNLMWIEALLSSHGRSLKYASGNFAPELRSVQRAVSRIQRDLAKLADANIYSIDYILTQPSTKDTHVVNGADHILGIDKEAVGQGDGDEMDEDRDEGEETWMGLD